MRGTRLEINLNALKNNLHQIQQLVTPNTQTIAIVKADSYGLGSVQVSRTIEKDVWGFGVATLEEAIELRVSGIKKPVIMLSPFFESEIQEIITHDITPTLTDIKRAELLNKLAQQANKKIKAHIKIDTGMGRIGLPYDSCINEIANICMLKNVEIQGLFTHFPSADLLDDEFCSEQINRFKNFYHALEEKSIQIPLKHIANSSALVAYPESRLDAVRPGILLYGTYPSDAIKELITVENVATFKAKIIFLKYVSEGETVSYGRTFTCQRKTLVAVIGAGYADGFSTLHSSKAFVYTRGRFAPVLGRVCMDYTMIDVTGIDGIQEGDDVILYGDGGEEIDYYSSKIGIIPYEALTGVSKRVPRVYV